MNIWIRSIVSCLIIAFSVSLVKADMFAPSHSCSTPFKPLRFNSQWELDNFNDEVRDFRSCIEDFVEEQETAIQEHRNAANEAIEEWNNFVQFELR